jgi:hypothetical protein
MTAPPRLSAWLLDATLAAADRDAVTGDLWEEYTVHVVPQRGVLLARWWYRWQVARSLAPLFFRSWEEASVARASAALVGGASLATVPAGALIVLRTFVLLQVPLKTTAEPSLAFSAALAAVVMLASMCGVAAAIRVLRAESRNG